MREDTGGRDEPDARSPDRRMHEGGPRSPLWQSGARRQLGQTRGRPERPWGGKGGAGPTRRGGQRRFTRAARRCGGDPLRREQRGRRRGGRRTGGPGPGGLGGRAERPAAGRCPVGPTRRGAAELRSERGRGGPWRSVSRRRPSPAHTAASASRPAGQRWPTGAAGRARLRWARLRWARWQRTACPRWRDRPRGRRTTLEHQRAIRSGPQVPSTGPAARGAVALSRFDAGGCSSEETHRGALVQEVLEPGAAGTAASPCASSCRGGRDVSAAVGALHGAFTAVRGGLVSACLCVL